MLKKKQDNQDQNNENQKVAKHRGNSSMSYDYSIIYEFGHCSTNKEMEDKSIVALVDIFYRDNKDIL